MECVKILHVCRNQTDSLTQTHHAVLLAFAEIVDSFTACVGQILAAQELEQGGFPRAVRAYQSNMLTASDLTGERSSQTDGVARYRCVVQSDEWGHESILPFHLQDGNPFALKKHTIPAYGAAMSVQVAIARIHEYESTLLDSATGLLLEEAGLKPTFGQQILVKPNLVAPSNAKHCSTNPLVVKSACAYLLDCGARVNVADSPAFGPASHVASKSGLKDAMAEIGLKVKTLKRAVPLELSGGGTIGLSKDALEADTILNVPKLKVHCQMTMSGAVKNLFGCVVGFRKAVAHNQLGHSHEVFRSMLMDVYDALPQAFHLMDAVRPLHKDGPIKGVPFQLGLLSASENGIAIDASAYSILGLIPHQIPLWEEALLRGMKGADLTGIEYPLEGPELFDPTGFELSPERPLDFHVMRILKGRIRSIQKYLTKS